MSGTTSDVRFWDIRRNRSSKSTSFEVRWVTGGRQHSRARPTKALAAAFLAELRAAARRGESFDVATGLPSSMGPRPAVTSWLEFVQDYVDMKWPQAAAKTRDSLTDALATVTAALVDEADQVPDPLVLRAALRQYLLPPAARDLPRPREVEAAAGWLARRSVPLSELSSARQLAVPWMRSPALWTARPRRRRR